LFSYVLGKYVQQETNAKLTCIAILKKLLLGIKENMSSWRTINHSLYSGVVKSDRRNKNYFASGVDRNGKTRYFYSREWNRKASNQKFDRVMHMCSRIKSIRERYTRLMKTPLTRGDSRKRSEQLNKRLVGTYLMIADRCMLRPGTLKMKKRNETIGFTTLTHDQVMIDKNKECVNIDYTGKNQIRNYCSLCDPQYYKNMKLFIEHDLREKHSRNRLLGRKRDYLSAPMNVNERVKLYIKDLRTFGANALFLMSHSSLKIREWERSRPIPLLYKIAAPVSRALFNTQKVTLSHYIHPLVKKYVLDHPPQQKQITREESERKLKQVLMS